MKWERRNKTAFTYHNQSHFDAMIYRYVKVEQSLLAVTPENRALKK